MTNLYDHETPVSAYLPVPAWIEQDICVSQIAAIVQGGCESGAYMPAVTYGEAMDTMRHHGDDVFEFLEEHYGELPPVPSDYRRSWSSMACFYLTAAVDTWAGAIEDELKDAIEEELAEADVE